MAEVLKKLRNVGKVIDCMADWGVEGKGNDGEWA